jgi:hypothetical protein
MELLEQHKAKIVKLFNQTTGENFDNGMTWYKDAYDFAYNTSVKYGVSITKVVGIIAALSPNNKWERNKIDTELFLSTPSIDTKVCTFKNQRVKALAIYNGSGHVEEIERILKGIKTCNFFNNILFHDTCDRVTVDMWAFRSVEMEAKTKNVKLITQAYQELAWEFNIRPHQLQAIVWGVIRGSLV